MASARNERPYFRIVTAISNDLRSRGLSYEAVAAKFGVTASTISNQLSGNKHFTVFMARRWSETFGYSIPFLLNGDGSLYGADENKTKVESGQSTREQISFNNPLDNSVNMSIRQYLELTGFIDKLLMLKRRDSAVFAWKQYLNGRSDFDELLKIAEHLSCIDDDDLWDDEDEKRKNTQNREDDDFEK